jgi:hypothetical protein
MPANAAGIHSPNSQHTGNIAMQIQHLPSRKSDLRHILAMLTADYIARGNAITR